MEAVLKTITTVTRNAEVEIFTSFVEDDAFIQAFISTLKNSVNGISFLENELGFVVKNYPDVVVSLSNKGELVIKSDTNKTFYLNADGELIFELEE